MNEKSNFFLSIYIIGVLTLGLASADLVVWQRLLAPLLLIQFIAFSLSGWVSRSFAFNNVLSILLLTLVSFIDNLLVSLLVAMPLLVIGAKKIVTQLSSRKPLNIGLKNFLWGGLSLSLLSLFFYSMKDFMLDYYYRVPTLEISPEMAQFVHHDNLGHAAIANMLREFGALSFGVDALVPIQYHVSSHIIYGQLSHLFQIPTLTFYSLYGVTLFFPLLIVAQFEFFVSWYRRVKNTEVNLFYLLSLFLPLQFVLVYFFIGEPFPGGWNSQLLSDSYLMSLIILFAFFNAFLEQKEGGVHSMVWLILILGINIFLIKMKISTGLNASFLIALYGLYFFWVHRKKNIVTSLLLTVGPTLSLFFVLATQKVGNSKGFVMWAFINDYVKSEYFNLHILYHYLP
ncbi:MAG: hypothetical protein MJK18_14780, partial [Bdellovibrionales bacterium]|nr:hypothetical protein [Bdellovibrionales bacterium]